MPVPTENAIWKLSPELWAAYYEYLRKAWRNDFRKDTVYYKGVPVVEKGLRGSGRLIFRDGDRSTARTLGGEDIKGQLLDAMRDIYIAWQKGELWEQTMPSS